MLSQVKTVIIAVIYYIVATLLAVKYLLNLPLSGVVVFLYLLPIMVNTVLVRMNKSKELLLLTTILPILSFIAYYGFGYLVQSTGLWNEFVQINSVASGDMAIQIEMNILSTSQLIFVGLLYMVGSGINHYLQVKDMTEEKIYA